MMSSNLCRDEKRTESKIAIPLRLKESVATYAAMKSGLKAANLNLVKHVTL